MDYKVIGARVSLPNKNKNLTMNGKPLKFTRKVLIFFLSRQISEGVNIRRSGPQAINSELDFYQPSTYKVRRQVDNGWKKLV